MKLTAEESRVLAVALKDPARYHSDGRVVAMFCATIAVLCIPLIVVLVVEGRSSFRLYYDNVPLREVFISLRSLLYTVPELVGAAILAIVGIGHVVYGVRTYGRHGHVITPFGVARIRGSVKRLIRYTELQSVKLIDRRPPQHRIITTELELKAKDGRTLSLFGFGVTQHKALIEADIAKLAG